MLCGDIDVLVVGVVLGHGCTCNWCCVGTWMFLQLVLRWDMDVLIVGVVLGHICSCSWCCVGT